MLINDWSSDVCSSDLMLIVANRSAADLGKILADNGCDGADYVISGLPFSTLPPGVGPAIVKATRTSLKPGGIFLVYQFSPKVVEFLRLEFSNIDRGFEALHVPPAQLFFAHAESCESVVSRSEERRGGQKCV